MTRVLLVGCGHVGVKHLQVLRTMAELAVCGVVDVRPGALEAPEARGLRHFTDYECALARTRPDLVIVATPPVVALAITNACARAGSVVLVEKPVVVDVASLRASLPALRGRPVFVAFQTHFARGLDSLLTRADLRADDGLRAFVSLTRRRNRSYYTGWRQSHATAGGVLHQQAIHGIALALRLWPPDDQLAACRASAVDRRPWKAVEDEVHASVVFRSGRELHVAASVDSPAAARHTLTLLGSVGQVAVVDGRNLEYGVLDGTPPQDCTHELLRADLYRALIAVLRGGSHPLLYPLALLPQPLEVMQHVYEHSLCDHGAGVESSERPAV